VAQQVDAGAASRSARNAPRATVRSHELQRKLEAVSETASRETY